MTARVMTRADAIAAVAAWRQRGERVVVASGVFDLLHVGHLRHLARARALGDRLVVAVRGDRSSAACQGPGRPVVGQADRARLVAALRAVDLVVIFDESTVDAMLEALRPDVHAEAAGEPAEPGAERDAAARPSGVTLIAGDGPRVANADLVERIRRMPRGPE